MKDILVQPLVSLCTYCYNGARFVRKYFDALLNLDWQNLELFFFNNGSKDDTGKIAEEYKQRLIDKGFLVHIIHYEENQCTCSLKQRAMKEMKGEYFCGCDSDDIMYPNHISKMVEYFHQNPNKGLVFCKLRTVLEETGETLGIMENDKFEVGDTAFINCFTGKHRIYTAIGYMMKTEYIDKVIPNRNIFQSLFGENYQLQLPFLYHNLHGYIDEVLGDYIVRIDSYSGQLNGEKRIRAYIGQEETILETFRTIEMENREYYIKLAKQYLRRERLKVAILMNDKDMIKKSKIACKEVGAMNLSMRLRCFTGPYLLYRKIFRRK